MSDDERIAMIAADPAAAYSLMLAQDAEIERLRALVIVLENMIDVPAETHSLGWL